MFRALLCPSSGARDYDVDYHIGLFETTNVVINIIVKFIRWLSNTFLLL